MIDIDQELKKYGLNREQYESCLKDIKDKINGSNDMDWAEIVAKYNIDCHSDTLRKASQTIFGGQFVADYFREKNAVDTASEGYIAQLRLEKEEVRKERQKLSDERTDYQRSLREQARRESFLEVIERGLAAQIEPLDYKETPVISNDEDMIVCLSDLSDSVELSPKSRKAYESNLKIWFVWVKDNLKNKKQIDIKPLEYKKFQNWMVNRAIAEM